MAEGELNVALSKKEWQAVLKALFFRQRDLDKVTEEFSQYKTCQALSVMYERVGKKIGSQI